MLAAGDTFRAAAIEQLQVWGQRIGAPVMSGKEGGDAAGIVFDGVKRATETGIDALIVDTAGRLQNKTHLMDELSKVRRVLGRLNPEAPHDVILVLDATTVRVGGTLGFTAELRNDGPAAARVIVDYVVHHRKANGSQTTKVFKLTTADLAPGGSLRLARRHSFKIITTRRYHPGAHAIELQVNGVAGGRVDFDLLPADA